jgi:hypothetical protein
MFLSSVVHHPLILLLFLPWPDYAICTKYLGQIFESMALGLSVKIHVPLNLIMIFFLKVIRLVLCLPTLPMLSYLVMCNSF